MPPIWVALGTVTGIVSALATAFRNGYVQTQLLADLDRGGIFQIIQFSHFAVIHAMQEAMLYSVSPFCTT